MSDARPNSDRHDPSAPHASSNIGGGNDDVRQAQTSGGASMDAGIARELSELARDLQAEHDPQQVMQRVVDAAVNEIPGATAAAITLLRQGKFSSPAHSNGLAARIGDIEVRTGEGPCVDTSRDELTLRSDDLRNETRWPAFVAEVVELGVLSAMSFQLFVEDDSMGALDVYSDTANAFDDDAENIGLLLASHTAIAMSASRQVANLRTAIDSRDLIGQAKGILMERYKIDGARAFDLLILSSQNTNTKLRDIAEHLTASGELAIPTRRPAETTALTTDV